MFYINDGALLQGILDLIAERFSQREEIPSYRTERGFGGFCATLERVKDDIFYPDLFSKATYLFININKGHFFSNGNKRLSIVVLFYFLVINGLVFKTESKDWYRGKLVELFPECLDIEFEDFEDFTAIDFCVYHLAILTAASGKYNIDHQVLKGRVSNFLQEVTEII